MRKLHYSSGYVIVADTTCKAVLRYARALAQADDSDVIMVPIVTESGTPAYAHFLLGPASELYSVPVEGTDEGERSSALIEELEKRTLELHPSRPRWAQEMTDIANLDDLEYEFG